MEQPSSQITGSGLDSKEVVTAAVSSIRRHCRPEQVVPRLSMAARMSLATQQWPGGMDELDACIRQALVLCKGEVIQAEDLCFVAANTQRAQSAVLRSVRAADGERSVAAKNLGISARSLRQQLAGMRAKGMPVPETQPTASELMHD